MKKQKWIFFVILLAFIAVSSNCKKSEETDVFDIRGTWNMVMIIMGQNFTGALTFSGNPANGTVTDGSWTGAYTVNVNQVNFSLDGTDSEYGRVHISFAGTTSGDNLMNGTVVYLYYDLNNTQVSGTWTCTR